MRKMSILVLSENAEQIVFTVSSDKCKVRLDSLDGSIEDYRENLDCGRKYMTNFTIDAFAIDDDGEKVMDVGFLSGIYFEAEELFGEEISFPMLCDMVSSDACEMAEAITDARGSINPAICRPGHNMMYIKKIFVEEQCRGLGVGRYLLDNLVPLLSHSLNLHPHACALMPYPQVKTQSGHIERAVENADKELPRLVRFYERAGFDKIGGSECMYKKHTDILDDLFARMDEE